MTVNSYGVSCGVSFDVPVNVWISSVFGVPVNYADFVSFWRTCERMNEVLAYERFVSSVFGVRCERMAFVSFWRTCERRLFSFWRTCGRMDFCERMGFVSSVFGVPVNVRISSVFDVPVIVWFRQFLAYL